MGVRRFQALSHQPKEILVGVCWPFAANQDGMADGLQLALEEINAGGLAGGVPLRLVLRDDGRLGKGEETPLILEYPEHERGAGVIDDQAKPLRPRPCTSPAVAESYRRRQ